MGDLNTVPAEAYSPDPDRADPDSPTLMPEWLAYVIALVILFIIETFLATEQRRARRPASRPIGQPSLPRNSAQPPAAAIRRHSNDVTARTRRDPGAVPESTDLSRTRAELLEKLRQSNVDPAVWSRLEELGIVPGPTGPDAAATPTGPVLAPPRVANLRRDLRNLATATPRHRASPTPRRPIARPGTGPPTGPPGVSRYQFCYV
jgi:hypothetical protein